MFFEKKMITVNTQDATGVGKNDKFKMDTAIGDEDNKATSFAEKCVDICSQQSKKMGATSNMKEEREDNQKSQESFHYQDFDKVE